MGKPPDRVPLGKPDEAEDLANEIAKRVGGLVPQGQQAQIVAQVVSLVEREQFSGPIAHPKHLREYEKICPGSADRIVAMAESSLSHTQLLQSKALQGDIDDIKAGRQLGFAALLALMLCSLFSVYLGHEAVALAFLGAGVLGVIGQFIQGRKKVE